MKLLVQMLILRKKKCFSRLVYISKCLFNFFINIVLSVSVEIHFTDFSSAFYESARAFESANFISECERAYNKYINILFLFELREKGNENMHMLLSQSQSKCVLNAYVARRGMRSIKWQKNHSNYKHRSWVLLGQLFRAGKFIAVVSKYFSFSERINS